MGWSASHPLGTLFQPQAQSYSAEVGGAQHRGLTVLLWVTVARFAQFVGPPIGSLMADHTGPRSVFAAASAGIAATWRPLRRSLVLRAEQGQKVVRV